MSNGAGNRSFNSDIPEENWVRTFIQGEFMAHHHEDSIDIEAAVGGDTEATDESEARLEHLHECEHCGRRMRFADQRCGCTSRRSGIYSLY